MNFFFYIYHIHIIKAPSIILNTWYTWKNACKSAHINTLWIKKTQITNCIKSHLSSPRNISFFHINNYRNAQKMSTLKTESVSVNVKRQISSLRCIKNYGNKIASTRVHFDTDKIHFESYTKSWSEKIFYFYLKIYFWKLV